MIHQSPSFGKLHQHLVCPTDQHTPSSRSCYNKPVPALLGVTALQANELVDKNKNNINWNVKSCSLSFPTWAHIGVPRSFNSEFFNPIQTGLLIGLLGLKRTDSPPPPPPSSLTPKIFNNNNNSKTYNVKTVSFEVRNISRRRHMTLKTSCILEKKTQLIAEINLETLF